MCFIETKGFVDAITAGKRASAKTDKRHDTFAVHVDSVTADGEDRCVTVVWFHRQLF
jgi:hypothetical protein